MRIVKLSTIIICITMVLSLGDISRNKAFAQDYGVGQAALLYLDRGLIWDSWVPKGHGYTARYAWWGKMFDYPGYESDLIKSTAFGPTGGAGHINGSRWGIGWLRKPGIYPPNSNPMAEEIGACLPFWEGAQGATDPTVFGDSLRQYIHPVSNYRWVNGENYYLRRNPLEAEEVIDSWWTWNPGYRWTPTTLEVNRHVNPVRMTIALRMWAGSKIDQMYEIEELTVKNISDDPGFNNYTGDDITLYDLYLEHQYDLCINYRSAQLTGQGVAKDNFFTFDPTRNNLMIVWNDDFNDPTSPLYDKYDFVRGQGPQKQGEWCAPGHVGVGYLYSSPNKYGVETNFHNYWNAIFIMYGMQDEYTGSNSYNCVVEGTSSKLSTSARYASKDPIDPDYRRYTWNTHITTGPWDLAPGESVKVVQFQGIGSVDPEVSVNLDKMATEADIATGIDSLKLIYDRALLATRMALRPGYATGGDKYKGWNMPDPPACPYDFAIEPDRGDKPGNRVVWDDWADDYADPDYTGDEAKDLASYTVWRSDYMPMMGWKPIGNIPKKSSQYYNASTKKYSFTDYNVAIGASYWYAINSVDTGHNTWPPRPEALKEYPRVFPGEKVPPLQSNRQASLNYHFTKTKWVPFRTQRNPGKKLSDIVVFPSPFVMRAGFINPGEQDGIHFANIPANCRIRIYSLRGDLVLEGPDGYRMKQDPGSGEAVWYQQTSSNQFPESGLYLFTVEDLSGPNKGDIYKGKFAIVR